MVRLMPVHVRAHPQRMRVRRLGIVPGWWDYYLVEIVGHGWTQAERHPLDVEYMARDWLACTYNTRPSGYDLQIEYITITNSGKSLVCPYCGSPYSDREARRHFIPCDSCDSLEHPGCQH